MWFAAPPRRRKGVFLKLQCAARVDNIPRFRGWIMAVRRPFVAGNWKMNGNRASAANWSRAFCAVSDGERRSRLAAAVHLIPIVADCSSKRVGGLLAVARTWVHASGAYTSEIAGAMLRD
jgi:triosephosphate isomerase